MEVKIKEGELEEGSKEEGKEEGGEVGTKIEEEQ